MTSYLWGIVVGVVIGFPAGGLYVAFAVTTGRWLGRRPRGVCPTIWTTGELSHMCNKTDGHPGWCRCVCGRMQTRRSH